MEGVIQGSPGEEQGRGGAAASEGVMLDPACSYRPVTFYQRRGKRIIDAAVAAAGLLITSPLFALLAIAICLETKGPPFYCSMRTGRHARPFRFIKFRSMVRDAERMRAELEAMNEMDGPVFKIRKDPRMTCVGRFLRRTSLDELPQLVNVLLGEMSLVGPRPPIPEEVAQYEPWQRRRLAVTPGITCLWQVSGRNRVSFAEWMKMDMQYVESISLKTDLKVLLLTVPAVLRGIGAS
ncbi:MAG: sugar transferase [Candidatus Eisenbacteria sp.]|nr:sugar transferase [Candidatus Eisenbacteria bacterium]